MKISTPPPNGTEIFEQLMLKIRESRIVHFARMNQTLLLAITCMIVVAILSVIALPKEQTTRPQATVIVADGPTSDPNRALATSAPLSTAMSGTTLTVAPTTTATSTVFDPGFSGRVTATTTEEVAGGGYPLPDNEPSGMGDVPTFGPLPTVSDVGNVPFPGPPDTSNIPLPTFPSIPSFPPSGGSGSSGRPTAVPPTENNPVPTDSSETYPLPDNGGSNPNPAPTNIPVPTTSGGNEPTANPGGDPTSQPPGNDGTQEPQPTLNIPIPTLNIPAESPTAEIPTETPLPPPPPADVISQNTRWTAEQSPVRLPRDTILAAGSTLTIDPGVEVQMGADVSLVVDGTLLAQGNATQAIRLRKADGTNWRSIVVNPGGTATLSGVDVRNGGSGGVVVAALGGSTVIQDSRFEQNSGQILGVGGNLDIQRTIIVGAAPIAAEVRSGGKLRLIGNSINNTASDGSTGVALSAAASDVTIDIQKNLFRGSSGTNVRAQFDQALAANFQCNTFSNGVVGLSIKSRNPTLDGSKIIINGNSFLNHKSYGLASDVGLDARNNWWGDSSGPYHPQQNGNGTGDAVGINLPFLPWLQAKPACSP